MAKLQIPGDVGTPQPFWEQKKPDEGVRDAEEGFLVRHA